MEHITVFQPRRERLFSKYDKGILTKSEVVLSFVDLLADAPNDESAVQLCIDLPSWFSVAFRDAINAMAQTDFYARTFGIGDMRTSEEVHQDALRRQTILVRLAPRIMAAVNAQVQTGPLLKPDTDSDNF